MPTNAMPLPIPLFAWNPATDTNFGDALSPVIVEWISGHPICRVDGDATQKLMAIGTLLEDWTRDGDVVWGTGSRCIRPENVVGKKVTVHMVRGPLTRDYLRENGIACPAVYGDPAILMPLVYPVRIKPPASRRWNVGLIRSILDTTPKAAPADVFPINVRSPWQQIIESIVECRTVISSSLHGIMVAESYGIPAIWLRPQAETCLKYTDYYLSTGRNVEPVDSIAEALCHTPPPLPTFDRFKMIAAFPHQFTSRSRRMKFRLASIAGNRQVVGPQSSVSRRLMDRRDRLLTCVGQDKELAQYKDCLAQHDAELAQRNSELAQRREELAQRDAELAQRKEELAQRDAELAQWKESLAQRDGELAQWKSELAQRDAELAQWKGELARRDAELALITGSRVWRLRNRLYSLPVLKQVTGHMTRKSPTIQKKNGSYSA